MKIDLIDFINQDLKDMSEAENYTFLYDYYCDLDNHIKQFLEQQSKIFKQCQVLLLGL